MIGKNKMKKIIALILVGAFIFTLCACNSKNTVSETDTSTPISSETFVKPENYTSVLLVSINPQFKLYLDKSNKVLAVEPMNDDAKSFSKSIDFENNSVETVVGIIVEKANEKGFIKENATVDFEITEQRDGIDNSDILTKVVLTANQKATELKIDIKTQIKEENSSKTEPTVSGFENGYSATIDGEIIENTSVSGAWTINQKDETVYTLKAEKTNFTGDIPASGSNASNSSCTLAACTLTAVEGDNTYKVTESAPAYVGTYTGVAEQ
jgi:hypothetical protein